MRLIDITRRKFIKFRFEPIRVFCFHHVSETYDSLRMWECDWMSLDYFKSVVQNLKKSYTFISLTDAHNHIKKDRFRRKKYAVLTSDDGYASLINILPWLEENHIPITLFINAKYLDGKSWSPINEEQARRVDNIVDMNELVKGLYLTNRIINSFKARNVEVASHGYEHLCAIDISISEFEKNIQTNIDNLKCHHSFIPFHAYTWGKHNEATDEVLHKCGLTPVLMDGMKNYSDATVVHREILK